MSSNTTSPVPPLDFEQDGEGRYLVFLHRPRLRIGFVIGGKNRWCAETVDGRVIGYTATRAKAGQDVCAAHLALTQRGQRTPS